MESVEAEIVTPPSNGLSLPQTAALAKPTTERAIIMAAALKEDSEQRAILQQYIKQHMQQGTDYGVIPGTEKPTLLKPGAEKLTDLFRCTPAFDLLEKIEDWEKGLFHYTFRVRISSRDSGTVLAEGYGSANSKEGRYRWRNAGRKCPQCGKETICKSKYAPRSKPDDPPGWYCYAKKGGCGAEFDHDDPDIVDQIQGKVENDDIFTLVNTILKMAKKRALVDGAIALARCSDIFTQDVEDFEQPEDPAPRQQRQSQPKASTQQPAPAAAKKSGPLPVAALWNRVKREFGEAAGAEFELAGKKVFGDHPKPSSEWTAEDCEKVSAVIFDKSDIPF